MIRSRDVWAALGAAVLMHMAYHHPALESVSVSVHLSWYLPRNHAAAGSAASIVLPAVLDIDGDGHPEAMAVLQQQAPTDNNNKNQYVWQVVDLKPSLHSRHLLGAGRTLAAPFRPSVLLESSPIAPSTAAANAAAADAPVEPLFVTTAHVLVTSRKASTDTTTTSSLNPDKLTDRTRHYFCGKDWHEASESCNKPCPKGLASECPDGERCFADTPCDALQLVQKQHERQDALPTTTTVAGGVPSVFCLWSNGSVSRHSIQAAADNKKKQLEIVSTWSVSAVGNRTATEWEEARLVFVPAVEAGNEAGLLLVSGFVDYQVSETDKEVWTSSFVTALDAETGQVVWESFLDDEYDHADPIGTTGGGLLPLTRGTFSAARRRSKVPTVQTQTNPQQASRTAVLPECWPTYKRSLLTSGALPFSYTSEDDALIQVLHFEQQQATVKQKKGHRSRHNRHSHVEGPIRAKPNVVVTHGAEGMQVRSLKNGRMVCQLDLLDHTAVADLNHDGVLDSVQVVTGDFTLNVQDLQDLDDSIKLVADLVHRVSNVSMASARKQVYGADTTTNNKATFVCHVQAISGMPAKEELFAHNLCGTKHFHAKHPGIKVVGAPPLLVEASGAGGGFRRGWDVVAAVNTGHVHRMQHNGRRTWHFHHTDPGTPMWESPSTVLLDRIDTTHLIPPLRPIVWAAENALVLLSAKTGRPLLSQAVTFPQPLLRTPVLTDFNGDGTTDVITVSQDAIWGYQVIVATASATLFRIFVGLLFSLLLLALLRHVFGPEPGKRSTDR